MPQNNLLLDFNPAGTGQGGQGGPFAEQLSKQKTADNGQQWNGYEGKLGDIAGMATKLLGGIAQGRKMKWERDEQKRVKEREVLQGYLTGKLKDPSLNEEGQKAVYQKGMEYWAKSYLNADAEANKGEKGKGKGKDGEQKQGFTHQLSNTFKEIALGMVGGHEPKHGDHIDYGTYMGEIEALSKDPKYNDETFVKKSQDSIQQKVEALRKENPRATQADVLKAVGPDLDELDKRAPKRAPGIRENLLGAFPPPPQHEGAFEQKVAELERAGIHLTTEQKTQGAMAYMGVKQGADKFMPFNVSGAQAPDGMTMDGNNHPIDRSGKTQYKIDETTKQWFPIDAAPVGGLRVIEGTDGKPTYVKGADAINKTAPPPQERKQNTQKEIRGRFAKIQDTKTATERQIEEWYSRAKQAVATKNALAAGQLGLNSLDPGDVEKEKVRRYQEADKQYKNEIAQANESFFPETGEPPAGRDEQVSSPTGPPAAAAPAGNSWTERKQKWLTH